MPEKNTVTWYRFLAAIVSYMHVPTQALCVIQDNIFHLCSTQIDGA